MSTIDINSVAGFKAVDTNGNELGIMSLADITAAVKESIMQDAAMARSVATQSEASTQAASDTYENKLPQLTDLTWARGLDSNGNPILISKESLASVVGELLSSKKLYPYMNRGNVTNFNRATTSGIYFIEDTNKSLEGNPGITYGTLEVYAATLGNTTIVTQVAYEQYEDKSCFRRTFTKSGNVADWISF